MGSFGLGRASPCLAGSRCQKSIWFFASRKAGTTRGRRAGRGRCGGERGTLLASGKMSSCCGKGAATRCRHEEGRREAVAVYELLGRENLARKSIPLHCSLLREITERIVRSKEDDGPPLCTRALCGPQASKRGSRQHLCQRLNKMTWKGSSPAGNLAATPRRHLTANKKTKKKQERSNQPPCSAQRRRGEACK